MWSLIRDVQFAIRQLRRRPGFALITMVTLGLGIGATTAIFSLVNTVVLRPLPFPEPDRLMSVSPARQAGPGAPMVPSSFSYPDFFDYRSQNHSFEAVASYHDTDMTLTGRGDPLHVTGEVVAADFFRVLRISPMLGRDFNLSDEKPQANVVILSHQLWQSAFGLRRDVVGQAATLNGVSYTIVGVMPKGFLFPIGEPAPGFYTTTAVDSFDPNGGTPMSTQRGAHWLDAIGRLKPGVSIASATADLSVIADNLRRQYPDTNTKDKAASVRPQIDKMVGKTRPMLRILFAAVGFVLLIACANVAGLLLARGTQRRGEIAVRSALGASRAAIIRQILIEAVVLAVCGGLLGIVVANLSLDTLIHLVPQSLPRLGQVSVDRDALWFAFVTSIGTAMLFGVLPAWRLSRLNLSQSIRQGSRTVTADRDQHRLQHALIIAETAIGLVLLVGSALLIHTFVRVMQVDPGFDAHNVLTANLSLPDSSYPGPKIDQFYRAVMTTLSNTPGVASATAAAPLPMSNDAISISFQIIGHEVPASQEPVEEIGVVMPDYFKTMRIPIIEGREFQATDTMKSQAVLVVTESFARKYFPGEDPIGKMVKPGLGDGYTKSSTPRQIVGVVADVKQFGLTAEMPPQYYFPLSQALVTGLRLVVRTKGDAGSVAPAMRAAVASLDPSIPLYDVRPLDEYVSRSAAQSRFQAVLLTCFAGLALLLFAVGLYAVLSYTVSQRTVEIGVRMALGAKREDMLLMFLRQGLRLTALGGVIGLASALALARVLATLATMLYEVNPLDPSSFLSVPVVIAVVAIAASAVPAIRAMSTNPMSALKDE
ncbi:MAG TPA: ABC transporter permease [Terriglobales bacterium]|nr:ABC transporter permease [Terriglobales bacterium]